MHQICLVPPPPPKFFSLRFLRVPGLHKSSPPKP
jgi:hypothetical protein